jgi:hypothetical protein
MGCAASPASVTSPRPNSPAVQRSPTRLRDSASGGVAAMASWMPHPQPRTDEAASSARASGVGGTGASCEARGGGGAKRGRGR